MFIGIDLGTTNSAAAVYKDNEIVIIKSKDNKMSDTVEKMFPSIVYINKKNNEILVGLEAKKKFVDHPQNTILEIKRKMGTQQVVDIDGDKYTPEQISSFILKKIKSLIHYKNIKPEAYFSKNTRFDFLISNNKKIAIYGASGKGQSLIQFCGLDNRIIEYVVDKSSLKHHKMTPGSHIPIYPTGHIYKNMPDVILLCAWNFADEIVKQEKRFISLGGKILHPLPMPHYLV